MLRVAFAHARAELLDQAAGAAAEAGAARLCGADAGAAAAWRRGAHAPQEQYEFCYKVYAAILSGLAADPSQF